MKWFLLWALSTTGAIIVMACIVVLLVRHRLRRHHRVDHRIATGAPLAWLADPRSAARLHRRLTRVGRTASSVAADHRPRTRRERRAEPSPLASAADDLLAQAVALDAHLARLAVLAPAARRAPLDDLARAVTELETAAARLSAISAELRSPRVLAHDDVDVTDMTRQLERLAEAHKELASLDTDAGLAARPAPTPPPRSASASAAAVVAARRMLGRQ